MTVISLGARLYYVLPLWSPLVSDGGSTASGTGSDAVSAAPTPAPAAARAAAASLIAAASLSGLLLAACQ